MTQERNYISYQDSSGTITPINTGGNLDNYFTSGKIETGDGFIYPKNWMEIDLGGFEQNIRLIREYIGEPVGMIAVTKTNGIGHGLEVTSERAIQSGADKIAVATPQEVLAVRRAGISDPLLMLYPPFRQEMESLAHASVEMTCKSFETIEELAELGRQTGITSKIHLQVETGMNRYGIKPEEVIAIVNAAKELEHISIQGISSHFATAGDENEYARTRQLATFLDVIKQLSAHNILIPEIHIANSAAVTEIPESRDPNTYNHFMPESKVFIRAGGLLYGMYGDTKGSIGTTPIMSAVVSHIADAQNLKRGESVGYCRAFTAPEDMPVATIPVGWGDGYLVSSSDVIIRGKRVKNLGLIASNAFAVENNYGEINERMLLFGKENGAEVTVEEIAERNGFISSQLMASLGNRLAKVYYE
jgi:alanine racemase